ncbi:trypsin-like serine protease [Lyngbya sp. PCC 8106]|uniref:trypsin-like serine protease n=1 Tax=Lyngbya sp. (strain PCC 8106) TaxID=313612 RepID=UPI000A052A9D|nr:trypsin-like serine protease [Lyngbya sp. PCC 8106]
MSMCFKKVGFLASTIVSTALSTVGVFVVFELNHQAKAIVVPGDPNDYIVEPGTGYDGVVRLNIQTSFGGFLCSGSLLPTGQHILTAAHCLASSIDTIDFEPFIPLGNVFTTGAKAFFELPTGEVQVKAEELYIHPNWNGRYYDGNDLAIIKLAELAPTDAERYDIYRGSDELGQPGIKVGIGVTGNGNTNERVLDLKKRSGLNTYDAFGEVLNGVFPEVNFPVGSALLYDFDNGNPANDALGIIAGIPNFGLGENEVSPSFGDSGGPTFIDGLVAGVVSDAIRSLLPSEIDDIPYNLSVGEIIFDTRVSTYAGYIDDVLAGNIAPTKTVPEPNTIFGVILALGAFATHSRSKKAK